MTKRPFISLGIGLCAGITTAQAQLVVSESLTPQQLVEQVLLGAGVTVSNVTYNGVASVASAQDGSGSFTLAGGTELGLEAGVILSSGLASSAAGNASMVNSSDDTYGLTTDADLEALVNGEITNGAVLEFDFVPTGDSLKFNYVFASEEYPEFVCQYNDAFGFFLSGPGINGTYSNNAINIALIPQTNTPVTIDNVNHGAYNDPDDASCPAVNPDYFIENDNGTVIVYDGLTVVLTARAQVQCGQTYHIKLAIADAGLGFGDTAYDSGVFLQAGSFGSNSLPLISSATVTGDGIISEGCEGSLFVLKRPAGVDTTLTINYYLTGSATPGADYAPFPNPLIIPEGQDSILVDMNPVADGQPEGDEDVTILAYAINSCGDTAFSSSTLIISDYEPLNIVTQTEVALNCDQDSVLLTAYATGGYGNTLITWATQPAGQSERWVPGLESGEYALSASDECPSTRNTLVVVDSGCEILIPNVITPNGDNVNDRFKISGILGKKNAVQIFDRWGKEVFFAHNYRNSYGGADLADGVYFYVVEVEDERFTGSITVLGNGK